MIQGTQPVCFSGIKVVVCQFSEVHRPCLIFGNPVALRLTTCPPHVCPHLVLISLDCLHLFSVTPREWKESASPFVPSRCSDVLLCSLRMRGGENFVETVGLDQLSSVGSYPHCHRNLYIHPTKVGHAMLNYGQAAHACGLRTSRIIASGFFFIRNLNKMEISKSVLKYYDKCFIDAIHGKKQLFCEACTHGVFCGDLIESLNIHISSDRTLGVPAKQKAYKDIHVGKRKKKVSQHFSFIPTACVMDGRPRTVWPQETKIVLLIRPKTENRLKITMQSFCNHAENTGTSCDELSAET